MYIEVHIKNDEKAMKSYLHVLSHFYKKITMPYTKFEFIGIRS